MSEQITTEQLNTLRADLQHLRERLLDLSQQALKMADFIVKIVAVGAQPQAAPMPPQDQQRAPELQELTVANNWTFRRPVEMKLGQNSETILVRSWRDVFRTVVALLQLKNAQGVRAFILQRSATNPFGYGTSPDGMQSPHEVEPGLFVNLGLAANSFRAELRDLIPYASGTSEFSLKVRVESDPEEQAPETILNAPGNFSELIPAH